MPSLQIRDVPDETHRRLKARAALAGQSLADYSLQILARALERPTVADLVERIDRRGPLGDEVDAADLVRDTRDSR